MLLRQLSTTELFDLAIELSTMRYTERKDAEASIRIKDYFGYGDHQYLYHQFDSILKKYFNCTDNEAFPEWPYDFNLVDPADFEYTPVVFSDGSTVEEADVPF